MSSKTMAEVLVEHQRHNASSCLCGWAKLGHSHPEHQAAALTAAGFGDVKDAAAKALEDAADDADALGIEAIRPASLRARAAAVRGER